MSWRAADNRIDQQGGETRPGHSINRKMGRYPELNIRGLQRKRREMGPRTKYMTKKRAKAAFVQHQETERVENKEAIVWSESESEEIMDLFAWKNKHWHLFHDRYPIMSPISRFKKHSAKVCICIWVSICIRVWRSTAAIKDYSMSFLVNLKSLHTLVTILRLRLWKTALVAAPRPPPISWWVLR